MTDLATDRKDIQRICPPHFFLAAWASDNEGVLFCRLCGTVMPLQPPRIEAPDAEKLPPEEQAQISRDYGEPT